MPEVRITAIAGTKPEKYARLAKEYEIPFFTTDWRELVASPEVDIIHLATPPYLHAEQGIAAAEAGKHIFCEKPLAVTLNDADAMLQAAYRNRVRLGINFVMRYSGLYQLLNTITQEGLLGAPQHFCFENNAGDLPADHWFWDRSKSGGIPIEHGVHFFDIFKMLFGESVLRWSGCTRREGGEEDKWLVVHQYGKQMYGSFFHAFDKPSAIECTTCGIEFERGRVVLDGWIPERLRLDGVVNARDSERLTNLFPEVNVTPFNTADAVLANGKRFPVESRITIDYTPAPKQVLYAQAVQDAMADFIAWTLVPDYLPRVTGDDARAALAMALQADGLAHSLR